MKIRHPNSKQTVETDNPEPYCSQGWVEAEEKPAKKASASKRGSDEASE